VIVGKHAGITSCSARSRVITDAAKRPSR
jgi:hypothetical protein